MNRLTEMLIRHEGVRLTPYRCSAGRLTIGYGRNLDDVGISPGEALYLLGNDVLQATKAAQEYPWFWALTDARQDVVIAMIFNLGAQSFREFKKMHAALEAGRFIEAATEMLASKWAFQVGARARELSEIMRGGEYLPRERKEK